MAIFFIGLSLNLIEKPNQGTTNMSSKVQQQEAAASSSWPKALDSLLSPFATSITPKELSLKNCSKTSKGFNLSEQSPTCEIIVPGFNETFKKLSLKPNNRTAKLHISYTPAEGDEEEFSWPEKDQNENKINFVILGKEELKGQTAATILFECTNCSSQKNVKITFE